jgi:hypothetical protein
MRFIWWQTGWIPNSSPRVAPTEAAGSNSGNAGNAGNAGSARNP